MASCCGLVYYCVNGEVVVQPPGPAPAGFSGGPWATLDEATAGCYHLSVSRVQILDGSNGQPLCCAGSPITVPGKVWFNVKNKTGVAKYIFTKNSYPAPYNPDYFNTFSFGSGDIPGQSANLIPCGFPPAGPGYYDCSPFNQKLYAGIGCTMRFCCGTTLPDGLGHTLTMRMSSSYTTFNDRDGGGVLAHSLIEGCSALSGPDTWYGPKWAADNNQVPDGCNTSWGGVPTVQNQKFRTCSAVWSPGAGELIGTFLVTLNGASCPNAVPPGTPQGSFDLWVSE